MNESLLGPNEREQGPSGTASCRQVMPRLLINPKFALTVGLWMAIRMPKSTCLKNCDRHPTASTDKKGKDLAIDAFDQGVSLAVGSIWSLFYAVLLTANSIHVVSDSTIPNSHLWEVWFAGFESKDGMPKPWTTTLGVDDPSKVVFWVVSLLPFMVPILFGLSNFFLVAGCAGQAWGDRPEGQRDINAVKRASRQYDAESQQLHGVLDVGLGAVPAVSDAMSPGIQSAPKQPGKEQQEQDNLYSKSAAFLLPHLCRPSLGDASNRSIGFWEMIAWNQIRERCGRAPFYPHQAALADAANRRIKVGLTHQVYGGKKVWYTSLPARCIGRFMRWSTGGDADSIDQAFYLLVPVILYVTFAYYRLLASKAKDMAGFLLAENSTSPTMAPGNYSAF